MASMKEFLTTGNLGGIHLGMFEEDLRELLGEPEATGCQRDADVWKYGPLQLVFRRQTGHSLLAMIVLSTENGGKPLPKGLSFQDWMPGLDTSAEEFLQFLAEAGLQDKLKPGFSSEYQLNYIVEPSAEAVFNLESGRARLVKVVYTNRIPAKNDSKQVSVSVPGTYWQQLQTLAAAQKTSVAKLCSSWLLERMRQELAPSELAALTEQIQAGH
jgi:hypothetical protein